MNIFIALVHSSTLNLHLDTFRTSCLNKTVKSKRLFVIVSHIHVPNTDTGLLVLSIFTVLLCSDRCSARALLFIVLKIIL